MSETDLSAVKVGTRRCLYIAAGAGLTVVVVTAVVLGVVLSIGTAENLIDDANITTTNLPPTSKEMLNTTQSATVPPPTNNSTMLYANATDHSKAPTSSTNQPTNTDQQPTDFFTIMTPTANTPIDTTPGQIFNMTTTNDQSTIAEKQSTVSTIISQSTSSEQQSTDKTTDVGPTIFISSQTISTTEIATPHSTNSNPISTDNKTQSVKVTTVTKTPSPTETTSVQSTEYETTPITPSSTETTSVQSTEHETTPITPSSTETTSVPSTDHETTPITPQMPASCLDLLNSGQNESGLYYVNLTKNDSILTIQVFCDMTTDGGGWTLVASVHEDDFTAQCDANDKWTTEDSAPLVSSWHNQEVFGNVNDSTTSDYKSAGYFLITASEIFVKTISNETAEVASFITKGFASNGYNNLYNYFTQNPLNFKANFLQKFVTSLGLISTYIKSAIPGWYNYTGGYQNNDINDPNIEGSYQVSFSVPGALCSNNYPNYGDNERCYVGSIFTGFRLHSHYSVDNGPVLNAVQVVANVRGEFENLTIQVASGANQNWTSSMGELRNDTYTMKFCVMKKADKTDIDISNLFYVIYNQEVWNSKENITISCNESTSGINFKVEGTPRNSIAGYTLLATENETLTLETCQSSLQVILNEFSTYDHLNVFNEDTLAIPLEVNSYKSLFADISSFYKSEATDGFLQLGAFNGFGFASAFCPGFKTNSFEAEYLCIGGHAVVNLDPACNDFGANIAWNNFKRQNRAVLIYYR